jgi:outer membrane lipoprotein-sorting protein
MSSKARVLLCILVSLCFPAALMAADGRTEHAKLTAAQIVEKHIAARGGLPAWRAVQTMSIAGKMEAGFGDSALRSARFVSSARATRGERVALAIADKGEAQNKEQAQQQVQLPFVMDMKRPGKSRVEIEFAGKKAVQTYDGKNGWKLRPFLHRNDVEPFTAEEVESTADKEDLDGPLIDCAARGTNVQLEAVEPVEGHDAYKLKLTTKNGHVQHIWIDAKSFLDVKVGGTPRRMDGRMHDVWVYQHDFRSVQGVMVPFVLETVVEGYRDTHRMTIEKVTLNPKLADTLFGKPQV